MAETISTHLPRRRERPRAWRALRGLQLADLKKIAVGVWNEITVDNVEVMAGGVAFFGTLSLFPAVVALVLIYGLVADPSGLERQLTWLAVSLVPLARDVLVDSIVLAGRERTTFGFSALFALLVAIWGASRATNALILSVQAAYDDSAIRGYLSQLRLNMALTATALVGGAVVLVSSAAAPGVLERLGVGKEAVTAFGVLRWPLLWGTFFLAVSQLYRFAPRKRRRSSLFIWPGALLSTLVWTLVSVGFSFYASSIGSYDSTYGPATTLAVFMTWIWLSAYVVIIGAEFNAELERHTVHSGASANANATEST